MNVITVGLGFILMAIGAIDVVVGDGESFFWFFVEGAILALVLWLVISDRRNAQQQIAVQNRPSA
ncbi:Uncharacterised protein [Mycobacteroides abscessus subsp. massiliense]|nr:Uncharacterised protein [Mycobacteroides abscessus subsp. massiliense]